MVEKVHPVRKPANNGENDNHIPTNRDETLSNGVHKEIPIPKVNECPFEEAERWAKGYYRRARAQVDWRRAKEIKELLPIETADYCEKMTFGKWRLTGPGPGQTKSPLQTVLDCLEPYIDETRWGKFTRAFTKQLERAFEAIHNSFYEPVMVKQMNDWINTGRIAPTPAPIYHLLGEFTREGFIIHLEFVLHPETAESYNSPRCLEIRRRIWEHYGIKFDLSQYEIADKPIPGRLCQMAMHFVLSVLSAKHLALEIRR